MTSYETSGRGLGEQLDNQLQFVTDLEVALEFSYSLKMGSILA